MKNITVKDILKICNGKLICGDENLKLGKIQKDTRLIEKGDTYIGIKGENFDGNALYEEALKKGASICIISGIEAKKYEGKTIIKVEDSITALQKLAEYKRKLYNIPIIAITGSVGKTSTKDIIASVMSEKYKVLKTEGNLNNHIGLPITIMKLENHEAMVLEMGMSDFGEIRVLTNIAHQNMSVITNIGTSHIKTLGSRENILKAKMEILEGTSDESPVIINNDNDLLNNWAKTNSGKHKVITYGINTQSDIMAKNITPYENKTTFTVEIKGKEYQVEVPVGGKHFVYNALSAICIGLENNIEIEKIIDGIKKFKLTKNRMEVIKSEKGITIINDTYNSSYDAAKAAIEYLHQVQGNRKIAILGDMLNLGEYEKELHEKVGEDAVKNKIDIIITVGKAAENIARKVAELSNRTMKIYKCNTNEEAIKLANKEIKEGDIVLVKASHALHFEEIVEGIK